MRSGDLMLFVLLMCILVPVEVACALLSYHTLGETAPFWYFAGIALNLVFAFIALANPRLAGMAAIVLALVIVPYQLVMGDRLLRLQAESARIVTFAYEEKAKTGKFPADLSAYQFADPEVKRFIQTYEAGPKVQGEFLLSYRVGSKSTSHWYSPATGWGYHPD
jgi:hypothetical protein